MRRPPALSCGRSLCLELQERLLLSIRQREETRKADLWRLSRIQSPLLRGTREDWSWRRDHFRVSRRRLPLAAQCREARTTDHVSLTCARTIEGPLGRLQSSSAA